MQKHSILLDQIRTLGNVCIVLHHTSFAGYALSGASLFLLFLVRDLVWVLPMFFLLSGYLLFLGWETAGRYGIGKIARRVKRLVIPFVAWNFLVVSLFVVVSCVSPSVTRPFMGGAPVTIVWFLSKVFGFCLQPGDPPLWYLRTLFAYALLSPLLFYILKRPILLILWYAMLVIAGFFCVRWGLAGKVKILCPIYSIMCFTIGGHMASAVEIEMFLRRNVRWILPMSASGYVLRFIPCLHEFQDLLFAMQAWFWPCVCHLLINRPVGLVFSSLIQTSFFVYAMHFVLRPIWNVIWQSVGVISSPVVVVLICMGVEFLLTVSVCVFACIVLRRVCPRVAIVLNGELK